MLAFLEKTASYLKDQYGGDLDKICIVLPNRRAGLFLKRYLAKQIEKTTWAPIVFSIEDFINEISDLQQIDPVTLLFEFYNTHRFIEKEKAQSFEEFLNWGQVLLHDFNEVDQYLIDPQQLFNYLTDIKAMALWNLNRKPLTEFESTYLKFYNSLSEYYIHLTNNLLCKKIVYQGLAYRKAAEQIEKIEETLPWKKIIFTGFNALTTAEEKIFKHLINSKKADILWDTDKYYLENESQEAGMFHRKYFFDWNLTDIKWIEDNFSNKHKQIKIIGVPQNIGQAKLAGQLIQDMGRDEYLVNNTAIVLANEKLLMPLLNSIPSNVCELNVTMGMPMNYNPVFNLIDNLFTLHETSFRLKNIGINQIRVFHYNSILKIINNPYITTLYSNLNPEKHTGVINTITQEILNSNKSLFTLDELEALFFGQVEFFNNIKPVFKTWHKPSDALECFNYILNVLKDTFIRNKNIGEDKEMFSEKIELEYIFNYSLIIKRINTLLDDYDIVNSITTLRKIFNQITSIMNIPFFGEPLRGVQIMGMLETRTLDFENIILLSANEGLIPSGKNTNSFIPYDIKKEFKIPTYKDKDAVFAYHFYRLLQRCQNITLLYNTESDQLGSGDKSRFITQLIHELPKYNSNITIEEKLLSVPPVKDTVDFSINISKTGDVINKIKEIAGSGFSPSSLNSYINCKLQFYFKEIIGLKETEEVEETIDAATLGTVIHDVLQNIYTPYINKKLCADSIKQMLKQVEQKTMLAFKVIYKDGDVRYGKNLLISKVANTILKNFLRSESELLKKIEKENGSMFIKLLEEPMETNITLKTTNETIDVKLKGTVDRIDIINNTYRIIDYKTGRTEAKELKLIDWESLIHDRQYSKSFQLLIYAYLFHKKYPEIDFTSRYEITSGINSLRQISSGLMSVTTPDRDNSEIFQKTEDNIKTLLCEMLDKDIPFSQTEELNNCNYCSFVSICNR